MLLPPCRHYTGIKDIPEDFDFAEYEARIYKQCLDIVDSETKEIENNPEKSKTVLWLWLTTLFCFGHIETLDKIIDYYPLMGIRIKNNAFVLRELLPLPKNVGINNIDLLKQWLDDNRQRLDWSKEEGRYRLIENQLY